MVKKIPHRKFPFQLHLHQNQKGLARYEPVPHLVNGIKVLAWLPLLRQPGNQQTQSDRPPVHRRSDHRGSDPG
jgi:hypothetical protein